VDDEQLPLRLEAGDDGSFKLTPDDWRSGDMSYAFDGSAILVVRGELARRLADWAVELDHQQDDLRARCQAGDKLRAGPAEPNPPQTKAVELAAG
jgi:hypothetical protein